MSKGRDRTVFLREDGKWINKRNDTDKISTRHATQKEAVEAARVMIAVQGGGELTIQGPDGEIQRKVMVSPDEARAVIPHPKRKLQDFFSAL